MDALPLRFIPETRNRLYAAAAVLLQLAVAAAAPFAWKAGLLPFAALLIIHVYGTVLGWLLIHEAIHGKLASNRALNDGSGRLLAILFGCPFHILKVGHMTHHKHNRGKLDTTELMPGDTKHPAMWGALYFARILGGLYVMEVLAPLAFFVWRWARRAIAAAANTPSADAMLNLFTRPLVNAIRADAVICLALFATLALWTGPDPWPLLLLFAARALAVSYYDNAYHYGTDPNDAGAAMNLSTPSWLKPLILNHNMHRVHHKYPAASWSMLPELFVRDGDRFDRALSSVAFDQLRGPVRRPSEPAS
jgi:fatty acid desaturase